MKSVTVQNQPFDSAAEQAAVRGSDPGIGALVSFVGLMRDINDGDRVERMTLEHYPGMTEKALAAIVDEACERWPLAGVRVVHRVGEMRPTDPIVLVVVASAHRGAAFAACEFIMDYLKNRAPFWKKEYTADGERWVAQRDSDQAAAGRWIKP
jgi:molybdopterin synthase catalytic subunit